MADDPQPLDTRSGRAVMLAALGTAAILGAVPIFFLFYSVIGSALFGGAILLALGLLQFLVCYPAWRTLKKASPPPPS